MKKYINRLLVVGFAFALFTACDESIEKPMIDLSGKNSVSAIVDNPATTDPATLLIENASEVFEKFTWKSANYGQTVAIMYTVQIDTIETFATAQALGATEADSLVVTVGKMNDIALLFKLPILTESEVYIRVVSSIIGVANTNIIGETLTRAIVPYENLIVYPVVYLPGAYQGWAPDAAVIQYLYSYGFNDKYENIVYFSDATEFKITVGQSWDVNYGGSAGALASGGDNFSVAEAGAYKVVADIGALTYSITKTDYWGLIGSATPAGWDSDQDMVYNGQRKMWEITLDLVDGEIKFRANDGWDVNFGDTGLDGQLDGGGDNIAVTAGNYTIRLDIANNTYTILAN